MDNNQHHQNKKTKQIEQEFLTDVRKRKNRRFFRASRDAMCQAQQIEDTRSKTSTTIEACKNMQDQAKAKHEFTELYTQNDQARKKLFWEFIDSNFRRVQIPGNGNCMYGSLIASYGLECDQAELRAQIHHFADQNKAGLLSMQTYLEQGQTYDSFLGSLQTPGSWGNQMTLLCFCLMLNCVVNVYKDTKKSTPYHAIDSHNWEVAHLTNQHTPS